MDYTPRTIVVEVSEGVLDRQGNPWKRTEVMPLDLFDCRIVINTLYRFPYLISPERMAEALQKALHYYPQIGATIVRDGNRVFLEHSKPRIELIIRNLVSSSALTSSNSLPPPSPPPPSFSLGGDAMSACCDPLPWPSSIPYGSPTMKITLTKLNETESALAVSDSHILMGAGGLFRFISIFGKLFRGEQIPYPSHSRETVINSEEIFGQKLITDEDAKEIGLIWDQQHGVTDFRQFLENKIVEIPFSLSDVDRLKRLAVTLNSDNPDAELLKSKIVSSNDVMCAHFVRLVCALRVKLGSLKPEEQFSLIIVVSIERFLEDLLGENNFGNSALFATAKAPVGDILRRGVGFSVNKIRDTVSSYGRKDVNAALKWMHHLQYETVEGVDNFERIGSVRKENLPKHQFFVTSRAKFKMYDVDFGGGVPSEMFPSVAPIQGFARISPRQKEDGFDFLATLSGSEYAALMTMADGMALTDPALVQRILDS